MMDFFRSKMLGLFIICVSLQDGCGLPLSDDQEVQVQAAHPSHIRTKRCSCNNWEDRECIYFCHLDIIWINTPSKLLPYGLGGSLARRRRRSANRCGCRDPTDNTCDGFCQKSSEDRKTHVLNALQKGSQRLLASLRSVVQSNMAIAKEKSSNINSAGAKKTITRR